MTRIAALGDAHLGRNYLQVTTPEGVNQREADFEHAFEAAVDLALAQAPDAIVLLGDIFDHPRPTYRSYRVAQRALHKIRGHGVPLVAISGNHDTPRLPGTGSPYSALSDAFPEMYFAHRLSYERFEVADLVVHAVPQMLTVEATLEALTQADRERSGDRTNLLLTHPRLAQLQPKYADINEIEVDAGALASDLVLLGHYHFHVEVGTGIWYAGSTDTFTFADDPEKPKGVVLLDTDSGECRHVAVEGLRPLVTLETVHALGLSPADLQGQVLDRVAVAPEGSIARLYVENADIEAWRLLDLSVVREAGAAAMHIKLEPTFLSATSMVQLPEMGSITDEWSRYLEDQDLSGYDRDRVLHVGREAIEVAVEEAG